MSKPFKVAAGFEAPHGSNIIWRYMSLEKFLVMLERQVLRFSQASKLTDNRELRLPYEKVESRFWKKLRSLDEADQRSFSETQWPERDRVEQKAETLRERTYLSSWSIAQDESYALWKIYLGGSAAGVAIKSTFSALQKAIDSEEKNEITCARVRYTDDSNPGNLRDEHFIYQKSTHYEYEKELRLAINYKPSKGEGHPIFEAMNQGPYYPAGLALRVDLDTLIKEIYLSPFSMGAFRKSFEQIVKKLRPELQAKVKTSAVRDA
jgi:hypothetical protein